MNTSNYKKVILVIRLSSLGDCLLLGPALRGLRNWFPDHKIVWLTRSEYAPIWQGSQWIESVVEWQKDDSAPVEAIKALGEIEYVLDLQASPRSRLLVTSLHAPHNAEAAPPRLKRMLQIITKRNWLANEPQVPLRYLRAAAAWGVKDDKRGLELPIDAKMVETVKTEWGDKKRIGLAPGAKHNTKRWLWENYLAIAKRIQDAGFGILWIVGPDEKDLVKAIENTGFATSNPITYGWEIMKTISAVSLCTAVVTNDSAALHIAVGTDRPGVALFGPTIQQFGFAPFRSHLEILGRDLWCRPCSAHGGDKCPLRHHKCMKELTVDMVWKKLHSEHIVA